MNDQEFLRFLREERSFQGVTVFGRQLTRVVEAAAATATHEILTLSEAVLRDSVQINVPRDATLDLRFKNSRFEQPLLVRGIEANHDSDEDARANWKITFRHVQFADVAQFVSLPVARECRFWQCHFACPVLLSADATDLQPSDAGPGDGAPQTCDDDETYETRRDLAFLDCQFSDSVDITPFGQLDDVSFAGSIVESKSAISVNLQDGHFQKLTFSNTLLLGRVDIVALSTGELAREERNPWTLSLRGTRLDGVVDLLDAGRFILDLKRAVVASGGLLLPPKSHNWLQFDEESDWHAPIPLGMYRIIRSSEPVLNSQRDVLKRLAAQYETLRASCRHVPGADDQEDHSHFKQGLYCLLADFAEIPIRTSAAITLILLTLLILLGSLVVCPCNAVCLISSILLPAAFVLAACFPRNNTAHALVLAWKILVLHAMLGHGVRIARILISMAVLIVLFATVYGLMSAYSSEYGVVVRPDPEFSNAANFITGERYCEAGTPSSSSDPNPPIPPLPHAPHPWPLGSKIQCSLYFSCVTFTTLGYGDYRPIGRLQVVAAVEAVLGALMIALIVVVFARRFLRL